MLNPKIPENLKEFLTLGDNYSSLCDLKLKLEFKDNLISSFLLLCGILLCLFGILSALLWDAFIDAQMDGVFKFVTSFLLVSSCVLIGFKMINVAEKISNKNYFFNDKEISIMKNILPPILCDQIIYHALQEQVALSKNVLDKLIEEHKKVYIESPNFLQMSEEKNKNQEAFLKQKELLK